MSFSAPLVLLALVLLPAVAALLLGAAARRRRALAAFTSAPLIASVAPHRPGWRRGLPGWLALLALGLLILAAARPRIGVHVPVRAATVMLITDTSASMRATDVSPSRLVAAQQAAMTFTVKVPGPVSVGVIGLASAPTLLAPPSRDHALARTAIAKLAHPSGHTAIGAAIDTALTTIGSVPKIDGHRPPGAIVLLSDGTSDLGPSPLTAAAAARRAGVRIDTVAIGTAHGTIAVPGAGGRTHPVAVPVDPAQLRQIASMSGGRFAAAPSRASAAQIYARLAQTLGHRRAQRGLIGEFAAAGLLVLLGAGALSLRWFGTLVPS